MMVRNSPVLRSIHDQPSLEASASGWGSSASTSGPSSSTPPLSHIGTRWSRRRKHLLYQNVYAWLISQINISHFYPLVKHDEYYIDSVTSSMTGDFIIYTEHWWSSGTGGQAKRFSGSMAGVLYKAPNHIALSMPDNKRTSWHWLIDWFFYLPEWRVPRKAMLI